MMNHLTKTGLGIALAGALAGCATTLSDADATRQAAEMMRASFAERGQAKSKSVGAVGAVRFDGKNVIAKVMVRDDAVNAKIANGKRHIALLKRSLKQTEHDVACLEVQLLVEEQRL